MVCYVFRHWGFWTEETRKWTNGMLRNSWWDYSLPHKGTIWGRREASSHLTCESQNIGDYENEEISTESRGEPILAIGSSDKKPRSSRVFKVFGSPSLQVKVYWLLRKPWFQNCYFPIFEKKIVQIQSKPYILWALLATLSFSPQQLGFLSFIVVAPPIGRFLQWTTLVSTVTIITKA